MPTTNPVFLVLKDGTLTADRPASGLLYVLGQQEGERFVPQGNVQGDGPLGQAGSSGWLELATGSFQGDQTARPPFPPYVRGFKTPQGDFRPSSRVVVY